jgi:hypothetical protein
MGITATILRPVKTTTCTAATAMDEAHIEIAKTNSHPRYTPLKQNGPSALPRRAVPYRAAEQI